LHVEDRNHDRKEEHTLTKGSLCLMLNPDHGNYCMPPNYTKRLTTLLLHAFLKLGLHQTQMLTCPHKPGLASGERISLKMRHMPVLGLRNSSFWVAATATTGTPTCEVCACLCMCVCVCARVFMSVCVSVCACIWAATEKGAGGAHKPEVHP